MRVVDKLEWPEPVSIDLLAEFRWLVGDAPQHGPSAATVSLNAKVGTLKETSPYTQLFAEAHRAKLVLTSAQIADRKVRRVADAMEIHVQNPTNNYNRPLPHKPRRRTSKPVEAPTRTPFLEDIDFKSWRDEAQACMAVPVIAPIIAEPEIHSTDLYERSDTPHEMAVPTVSKRPSTVTADTSAHVSTSSSVVADVSPPLTTLEATTKDEQEFHPEFPQDPWVTAQLDPVELTQDVLLDPDDGPSSFPIANQTPREGLAKYSVEMQRRIRGTIYAHAGTDMWTDQTSSLLAAEMSADIIFGDGTEGNATPFDTGAAVLPDPVQLEADWIQLTAAVFRDAAQTELAYGHVQAAVATLETGVHKLLQDDNVDKGSSSWGFNYSMAVHAHATTIQKAYRRRFGRMNNAITNITRLYRGFHIRRRLAKRLWLTNESAACIQRWWHACNLHKEAMRLRIQTAMRAKLARKEVHARRQRKMLVRNLALFVKAWLVGYHSVKQRRLRLGHAQFCAQTKDRWIRGYVARYRVRQLKRRLELDEAARSSRERAYTVTNVAVKMADFQRQLISASKSSVLGARRTRLTLQLKATASQRSDARKHLPPEAFRRAQVRDVFDAYDVDGSGTIDATELKSLFDELGIVIDRRGLHDALDAMDTDHNGVVDFDEFIHWLHSPPAQQGHRVRRLNRPELVYLKMKLNMKHLLNRFTDASYSQHAARLLVHDESVRQASAVVLAFRALEPPAYACLYCGMAFALYKSHWTHQRTCDKNVTRQFPRDGSPEDDEVLRKALEDEAVAAAVAFGVEHVHAYVATPSGRRVLRREMQRVKRLTPQRANAATKMDSIRLHYLFHSYDLGESGYLDRREFAEIARDLGEVTTPSTFDALDMTGTGKLSFAIFEKWATSLNMTTATGPMAAVRRFKRLWTRLVYGNKAQRRAEALRYVIAREKKFIETKTRREFRKVFPPRYQCSDCQAALCRQETYDYHMTNAIAIHTRQKEMLASLHHRIGLTDTVKSVLQVAADETKDTEMNAAVQRYLHTISGQHAVNSTALTLRALRIQTHTSTGTQGDAFVAGLVRLLACIDDRKDPGTKTQLFVVPVASLAALLRLLHHPVSAADVSVAVKALDPSHSGRIDEVILVSWLQQKQHVNHPRRRRGFRTWKQAARVVEVTNYRHHLSNGGLEWMDEDQDLVSMTQARAWVRRFKTYLSTADGKVTLAQEITALKQRLDPKGPIESRAGAVYDALSVTSSERLERNELVHALAAVGCFMLERRLWPVLDPDKSGAISRDAFVMWYPTVHVFENPTRLALTTTLNVASLGRAVVAIRFDRSRQHITVPKSEAYCASTIGMPQVRQEAVRIAHLWQMRRTQRLHDSNACVAFAFDMVGSPTRTVHSSVIVGLLYFANCPFDDESIHALSRRQDGQIDEAAVLNWLRERNQTLRGSVGKRLAARIPWLRRKDKILRLAQAVVENRRLGAICP